MKKSYIRHKPKRRTASIGAMQDKRILKNTLVLYVRQIVIVLINLFSIRVVLAALGVEGYGIYSVVVGFVMLLSFLPGAMASATQRFFSFAIGQQSNEKLKQIFSVNCLLYIAMSIVAILALESIGVWFVEEHLVVPEESMETAQALYHMAVFTFAASVVTSPFMAIIIAHEDMKLFASLTTLEAVLKLVAACSLSHISGDKLELYGALLLLVACLNSIFYLLMCSKKYEECQFRKFYWEAKLAKEIIEFTGWTLFGQMSTVFRNQAVTVLVNQVYNPATVAARAIAMTVSTQALIFSQNFNTSLYPPIIKSYAANERGEMLRLVFSGSKLTFFLMWVFALPLLVEMEFVLGVWLETPPAEAVMFTRLALVEAIVLSLSLPLATAARALGRMKLYESALGGIQLLIFFVSWVVLNLGYPADSVFVVAIIANIVMFKVRLMVLKMLMGFPIKEFSLHVILPLTVVVIFSAFPVSLISFWAPDAVLWSIFIIFLCVLLSIFGMYLLGINRLERARLQRVVLNRFSQMG